ncbi:MAG TPA: ABC transporter ATP-binding protein, partial [Desulfuromonadaceae bacterium]
MVMKNAAAFAPPKERLKLSAYVFRYRREFWIQAAGGIIYNTVIVMGPVFLGKSIDAADQVIKGLTPVTFFYQNLLLFFLFTVFFQLARYFKRRYMREIVNRMKCDIRAGLLSTAFGRSMQELDREKVGDMMSRMIGDVEQVGQSVQITITEVWDTFLLMISYLVACMLYSPQITLLAAIPVPLTLLLAELLRHPLYNLSLKSSEAASKINVHLQHNISGIALLRLFGREEAERETLAGLLKTQLKWSVLTTMLQNGMTPVYILVATCGVVAVVGMGGKLVVSGEWSIGMFTAYLALFTAMAIRTNVAAKVFNSWHGARASWNRIMDKLCQQSRVETVS